MSHANYQRRCGRSIIILRVNNLQLKSSGECSLALYCGSSRSQYFTLCLCIYAVVAVPLAIMNVIYCRVYLRVATILLHVLLRAASIQG